MKKKIIASLVATMAVGATCAFAANPFVDVPSDSWAYQSVVTLAESGIIQGVDGTHFEGDRNITRYEAAEIVAKAMAHQDRATVEQRALINKLADEFSDELNSLGVRVSNLEKRVGNVKLSGDARIRFIHQKDSVENDASWSARVRLQGNAMINDSTKAVLRVSTNNISFADTKNASSEDNKLYFDKAYVDHNFGSNWDLMVGRYQYVLGNAYGYEYGDTFDGAQLKYNNGKFAATAGYGKFKEANLNDVKTGYGELEGFFDRGAIGVYYNSFNLADSAAAYAPDNLWGAYASLKLGQKTNLLVDYTKIQNNGAIDDADVWAAVLKYGNANFAAPKTWDAWVEYINADPNAFYGSTNSWRGDSLLNNVKSWGVGVDYTFAKNAQFQVMQSFASSAKKGDADPEEETRAQFMFVF